MINTQRKFVLLGIGILIVVVVLAATADIFTRTTTLVKDGEVLHNTATGKKVGIARKEYDGAIWRVFATVQLSDPGRNRAYHGWLADSLTDKMRYVGEFFPTQEGYSLTYTTEEDIRFFSSFQVSEEALGAIPEEPSNNRATWEFEETVPMTPTPTASPEPSPEVTPEVEASPSSSPVSEG